MHETAIVSGLMRILEQKAAQQAREDGAMDGAMGGTKLFRLDG